MITIQLREDGAFVELEYNGIKSFRNVMSTLLLTCSMMQ